MSRWLIIPFLFLGICYSASGKTYSFGLSADVTPLSDAQRSSVEAYLAEAGRPTAVVASALGRLSASALRVKHQFVESEIAKKLSLQRTVWSSLAPDTPAQFSMNLNSRETLSKVSSGIYQFAVVRGDTLASLPPAEKKNLCIVGTGRHSDQPGRQFVVLGRRGEAIRSDSRLVLSGVATPREGIEFLKQKGLAGLPRGTPKLPVSSETGLDDLVDDLKGVEFAIVPIQDWAMYRRRKPGRSSALEPILQRGNYVVLSRLGEFSGELSHPGELAGRRVGIYPSVEPRWEPDPPVASDAFQTAEASAPEYDNAEDPMDDVYAKNGADLTLVTREAWQSYQRRKPGRAAGLTVALESPRFPPLTLVCNRNLVSAAEVNRLRQRLTSRDRTVQSSLMLGALSGVRLSGFDAPAEPNSVPRAVAGKAVRGAHD